MITRQMRKHVFVIFAAASQDHKLGRSGKIVQQQMKRMSNNIDSFLMIETGDHCQQRDLIIYREVKTRLQSTLVEDPLLQVFMIKILSEIDIGKRIPEFRIETVENSMHVKVTELEQWK